MSRIKRVGIDLDGTVADYMAGAIPLLQLHYGLVPDFTKSSYTVEGVFGLTKETRPEGMRELLYEELHLFRQLPKLEEDTEQLTSSVEAGWSKGLFRNCKKRIAYDPGRHIDLVG